MKHKIRRSLLNITLVLALLLPMFSFAFPATTSARFIPGGFSDPGQSAVESLHSYLADINTNCHDMAEGSILWNDCQDDQNYLNAFAGCSGNMFTITGKFSSGNDSGDDKWGVDQGNVSDCQDKLQDLATISGNAWDLIQGLKKCDGVVEAGDNSKWDACQNNYQAPLEGIGCSDRMFGSGPTRHLIMSRFNSCLNTVNAMIDFAAKQSCQKTYSGSRLKACEDGYVARVKGQGASSTCSKYSGQDKAACQDGFGSGSPAGAGGGGEEASMRAVLLMEVR